MATRKEQRILLYRLGSLGDMVVALPALHLVQRAFPNAERRLLTNVPVNSKAPAAAAVLDGRDGGTGLVHGYFRYTVGTRNPRALLRLAWEIRRWRPEAVVYLAAARGIDGARRDARFFRLCGVRQLFGVPLTEPMQTNFGGAEPGSAEAKQQLFAGELEPEAARLVRNLSPLGEGRLANPASWNLHLSAGEQAAADHAIGEAALATECIAVSVGTKVQAKDWGRENWRALLARLAVLAPHASLLLCGAPEEAEASEFAAEGWRAAGGGLVVNLCGRLSPRESAAALHRATLFVGHDSGPMHLAAAAGTPCVAIFAARNIPRQWFPFGAGHRVIYHRVECWGCALETCIEQRKKCLMSITVDEVAAAVEDALAARRSPAIMR